ncbi:hypothetical protein SUGI_0297070 [Cryptomeria japonica]|uniref:probable ubiquitin-conjugating enzyme E2 23 n=1 Tax=Cryptomeria japonica TaxID=3369 RepID=UPI002408B43F|nr:probable ubiquitin-conjugating enzyme E2 23 [Cryptomeria japonica]XP_059074523.1 probable ubiquitin-conjugating enzyme E2 23 [Cryptomeria japonica]XP_059074524.1 probable ubiquitin-conjugating enzyme E2 23 [Cryptomeria japonica]XP_059074525.1 probable ubiquitin-conjugating enzyme E2 23 [Cryptomeria japonica]GLJ17158.1 hypothetical protein SUGI_0297070 [Cryptomeria japonica]
MVMGISGYLELESSSSDSEDQDESESIFEGHAQVIWTSLAETIEKIDDILVVDRAFLHGDIVASVSDPSGQTGTIVNVDLTVDLKAAGGEIIRNINSKKLVRVCAFAVGDYVIYGPWLGRVEGVDQNVTVLFNDNAKCKIRRADHECLIPVSQNLLEEGYYPYFPGQHIRASSSAVFKNARWLQGRWKAGRMEGIISDVDVGYVHVKWIASAMPGCGSQSITIPAEQQNPKKLTLLSCFSHVNWQLGDWCLLTTKGELSGSVSSSVESSVDTETNVELDCLKFDLGRTTDDILNRNKTNRSPMKHNSKVHKKGDVIEQALFVVNTKTKVDVVWQDGTHSFCLDSRTLFPVDNLGDHDFWPEQYVQEKGQDEDGVASNSRQIGVVKSVDSKERTVRVKWLKPMQHPEDPHEFDKEEVVSVYELTEHPDYSYCIGDIVILLPSVRERFIRSGIVNHFGQQNECQNNLEPEKNGLSLEPNFGERGLTKMTSLRGDGCVGESYLSFIGYIIGLQDGDIEVAWADGMVSKVGPQAIIVVSRDEDMDSTQSSSEEDDYEEGTEDSEDNAADLGTNDSDEVYMNKKEWPVEEASSAQIDTHGYHGIANRQQEVNAEERLNQNNGGVVSISQTAFEFVAKLARGLLGFQGSNVLLNMASTQGEPSQKHILNSTELGIWQKQELIRGSEYHLSESVSMNAGDGLNTIYGSAVLLGGIEEAEIQASKDELEDTHSRIEDQGWNFRKGVTDSEKLTIHTVEKQKKEEDYLSNVSALGNNEFGHFKQFDSVTDPNDHFFFDKTSQSSSQRQWIKKVQQEWAILENNLPDSIYVRVYEDRMDLLRAAITGAVGTPYQDGLFFFDIHLPNEYPRVPPSVHYHSGGLRLNPNLYENGKICLSLLNTWTGRGTEVWDPKNSSILQVLVSLQSLVLNAKPYFNEAGYDKQIGRAEAEKNSLAYNENAFLLSCKSMLYLLRKPPKHFESFVREHFCKRGRYILGACNAYMKGTQVGFLSGKAVMPLHAKTVSQCNSSNGFKIMLDKLIPKLVSALSEVGADYEECLQVNV